MLLRFLSRYPAGEQERFRQKFHISKFPARTVLFVRGDESREVYFIERGTVKAVNFSALGRTTYLVSHGAGELVGHFAVLSGRPRSADVVCETECILWRCEPQAFLDLVTQHADNARDMMHLLAETLSRNTDRLTAIVGMDATSRVGSYLLSEAQGQKNDRVSIPSRDDLASYLNMTRESLSRGLSELAKEGLIDATERGFIRLLDKTGLVRRLDILCG